MTPPSRRRQASCVRRVAHLAICVAAGLPAWPAAAQAPALTPGRYEATLQVTIDGESEPPEKDEQCLSQSDIDGLDQWLATAHGADCNASDRTVAGGTIRFVVRCADDAEQTSTRGELVTRQDAFDAVLRRMDDTGALKMESTFTVAAHRVGECRK